MASLFRKSVSHILSMQITKKANVLFSFQISSDTQTQPRNCQRIHQQYSVNQSDEVVSVF